MKINRLEFLIDFFVIILSKYLVCIIIVSYICYIQNETNSKIYIMKTYITINKTATQANSKKEAAKNLGVTINNVHTSAIHLDYLKGYTVK